MYNINKIEIEDKVKKIIKNHLEPIISIPEYLTLSETTKSEFKKYLEVIEKMKNEISVNDVKIIMFKINELVKEGKIIITKNALLGQSFKTYDDKIKVEHIRRCGGFLSGSSYYYITENSNEPELIELIDAYKKIVNYFENKGG